MDCYHTVLWETVERGVPPEGSGWGDSPLNGVPKYSSLTWNKVTNSLECVLPEFQNTLHRQWSVAEARRVKAASLSDVTVLYCGIGEHMERGNRWVDINNHRTSKGGGTNVVFADSHVEWVEGTRVGWP